MATRQTQTVARLMRLPSIVLLLIWMIVPLAMTVYFATLRYDLLNPAMTGFVGLENFEYFLTDPAFLASLRNTLVLVGSVLAITVVAGILIALALDQFVYGQGIVRLLVISPFFVMPTVSALVWKNLLMHPVSGLFAWIATSVGLTPIDWFAEAPLFAIILMAPTLALFWVALGLGAIVLPRMPEAKVRGKGKAAVEDAAERNGVLDVVIGAFVHLGFSAQTALRRAIAKARRSSERTDRETPFVALGDDQVKAWL